MTGTARIIRGDALNLPLADKTVDLIVTSPPYFGLRSYQDGGQHYPGQIGSEATPAEFVDALISATREMVRVLKPSGSIWVNLGDKYAQDSERSRNGEGSRRDTANVTSSYLGQTVTLGRKRNGVPRKSLIGIPWRYALRCIDDLRLILRAEIIWSKPNGLPESVTDRVRRSHEQWFHITVQPRYFSAVDEIREEYQCGSGGRQLAAARGDLERYADAGFKQGQVPGQALQGGLQTTAINPLGKLPGSVWTVPTQPLQVPARLGVDHFAAFPMEWPRRIIQAWSPAGICTACGEGRRPGCSCDGDGYRTAQGLPLPATTPATVLDPFGGTGTTALVAKALGRTGISVDMSADYCRLAEWRTNDPGQLAAALQVEKPDEVSPDQLDLFSEDGAA